MQIPIVSGIYTDSGTDVRTSYPVNRIAVSQPNGVSSGYLKPAEGLVQNGTGPGVGRGGINWDGVCYRVMGSKLVSVASDGTVTTLGDVGNDNLQVTLDYSFDRLAIASNGNLFYWDGTTLTQVTDPDLGTVVDMRWIDGYFMTTDGENLVVTDLADPTQVDPTKYGSSEIDPDPVLALLKFRNEMYVLNRYTIEAFDNIGGTGFPFERIEGAQIQKGTVGTHSCCVYMDTGIAFVGGGRNEDISIYIGANGRTQPISTREIDLILQNYTETELSTSNLEYRKTKDNHLLYLHLPDRSLVYDGVASQLIGQPVWSILTSSIHGFSRYKAQHFVQAYDQWLIDDPTGTEVGYMTDDVSSHYGEKVRWEFSTPMVYNEGNGAIVHELELVALTGRIALGDDPRISTSYSVEGATWSQDNYIEIGKIGNRTKRIVWFVQGSMEHFRMQRFRGDSDSHASFMRLQARLEPLQA